jgi:hypothetical protein
MSGAAGRLVWNQYHRHQEAIIRAISTIAAAALIGTAFIAAPARAQHATQTVSIETVDIQMLAGGYRTSQIVGSNVINDSNETIGKIDDLLVDPTNKVLFAILSVGGFLGMGKDLVAIPFNTLQVTDDKIVLPGGTKDALAALHEFKYSAS